MCGLVKGLKRKGGLGFIRMPLRLTPEERFLMSLELKGKTIYDIGGHIGFLTLFFARSVGNTGKVITFEPNPESCAKLQENVRLNNFVNVEIKGIGLGKKREKRALAVRREEPATGSMEENIQSKILKEKWTKTFQVEIDSLDSQIELNSLPKPDFVKIDVEYFDTIQVISLNPFIPKLFSRFSFMHPRWRKDAFAKDYSYDNVEVRFAKYFMLPFDPNYKWRK
jgi:FkbM family methyltransferase